jgi:hypothetical protein
MTVRDGGCCTQTGAAHDVLAEISSTEVTSEVAAIRAAGFRLLLARGQPVPLTDVAAAAGVDAAAVDRAVAEAGGRVEVDAGGDLVGIAGLSVAPTPHQIAIGGATRWTWCALDAVGILGALEATGTITSTDPHSGQAIRIEFVNGEPDDVAALFVVAGFDASNAREEWCPLVNFFATEAEAEAWVAKRQLAGEVVNVAAIAEEAAAMWRPVAQPGAGLDQSERRNP